MPGISEDTVRIRVVLAASLSVASVVPGTASATVKKPAVKKVCNLVTDATGDTFAHNSQEAVHTYGPQEDSLDIRSVDLASDSKWVTGVVRLVNLGAKAATAPYGSAYEVEWQIPDAGLKVFYLSAVTDPNGATYEAGWLDPTASTLHHIADAKGTFDLAKNEVRISAPVGVFAGYGKGMGPGLTLSLTGMYQNTSRNAGGVLIFADTATASTKYITGTTSCVTPGR
jgi:hypothetical protein